MTNCWHYLLQSVSGASVWSEGKDKQDAGGQLSTWDVDTFIKVVKELAPHISFREVVYELDHPTFYISDTQGLRLVKTALVRGLQQEIFPIEALYRIWKNYEGQVSPYLFHHNKMTPAVNLVLIQNFLS